VMGEITLGSMRILPDEIEFVPTRRAVPIPVAL